MTDDALNRYLFPLRRWWAILLNVVIVAVVLAWITAPDPAEQSEDGTAGATAETTAGYRASHVLLRGEPIPATEKLELVELLAVQGAIPQAVVAEFDGRVDANSIAAVNVDADPDLGTVTVSTVQPTPELAGLVATAYANAIQEHFDSRAERERQERIERSTARLEALDARIQELVSESSRTAEGSLSRRIVEAELDVLVEQHGTIQSELNDLTASSFGATFETLQEPAPVAIADPGVPAAFSIPESRGPRVVFALVVATALGYALVMGVDRFDTRIRSREDAEDAFGLPVVSEIPRVGRREREMAPLPTHSDPGSSIAESYRSLRVAVQLTSRWRLQRDAPTGNGVATVSSRIPSDSQLSPRTVLVSSAGDGEGKSSVVANLAASMAESGEQVLVIDCDFRRPTVHELLRVHGAPSLHDLTDRVGLHDLTDRTGGSLSSIARNTLVPNVSLISGGKQGHAPAWFLAGSKRVVEMARDQYDVVIFDTGPILATNEASALVPYVDAVIVVARSGRTTVDSAKQLTERLTRLQALVAGVALVGTNAPKRDSYYQPLRGTTATPQVMRK